MSDESIRPGYKRTDVGVLPEDWTVSPLSSIAFVTSGKRLPKGHSLTDQETPHPYIRVSDMRPGTVSLANIRYVPENVFPLIQNYRIFKEDIFISVAGTLGIIGEVPPELDGANLTENADRITNISCSKRYLLHVLTSPLIQNVIDSVQTVGAQPKLALTRIRNFAIPLPPTQEEQHTIAEALSDVDAMLDALDRLIAKKHAIKRGAMQALLTGRVRLPGFARKPGYKRSEVGVIPEDWDIVNVAAHATLKARIGWQGLTTAEYLKEGSYYLVTGTDFVGGKIDWDSCHYVSKSRYDQDKYIQLQPGDVLITKDGTIGKIAYIDHLPRPATLNSGVFVIRSRDQSFSQQYFYYVLESSFFERFLRQLQAGSTINHLYQKDFVNFDFPAPSYSEQTVIAEVLSDMDAEIDALEIRRSKLRDIKQGMMQELLTGRIRLVQPQEQAQEASI